MTSRPAFADFAKQPRPDVALVLGSGLGRVAERLQGVQSLPFAEVPELPGTSVAGHAGCLKLGDWSGRRVLAFEGRPHFYEGHTWREVTLPVHLAAFLGARMVLLTNAAGGIHEALAPGALMAVRDHVEWTYPYCWRQAGPHGLGQPRSSPYSARLLGLLSTAAADVHLDLQRGIYGAVTGPTYETPAEIRALRQWGVDAVGMSTAREVDVGWAQGLECAAISCITNRAAGLNDSPIHHDEVLTASAAASDRLADLLERFLQLLTIAG